MNDPDPGVFSPATPFIHPPLLTMKSRMRGPWRCWKNQNTSITKQTTQSSVACRCETQETNYFLVGLFFCFFFVHLFMPLSSWAGLPLSLWRFHGSRGGRCGGSAGMWGFIDTVNPRLHTHTHTFYTADWTGSTAAGSLPTG